MKKTKIIIPALAMMAVTAAAGISGSVAWFTANRTAIVTAGEFAVVNTTSNLAVTLGSGVGASGVDDATEGTHTVTVASGNKLTDGTLDHAVTDHKIVAPDETGEYIGKEVALGSATGNMSLSDATSLVRDVDTKVYTAFTWTMTFTVTFGNSASFDLGLFLDLSSADTYMHEKFNVPQGTAISENQYYSDPACKTYAPASANTGADGTDVYKVAPDETGKAFRIAFIPTAIGGTGTQTSIGYSKVWAKNETAANCGYIDTTDADYAVGTGKLAQSTASYGTASTKLSGNNASYAASTETLASGMVLMDSSKTDGIPQNGNVTAANALAQKSNYLGLFKLDAGKTVSITYTCVAWFDGTDVAAAGGHIVSGATDFETIVTSMKFGVANLAA